jgi:hypothetical protein
MAAPGAIGALLSSTFAEKYVKPNLGVLACMVSFAVGVYVGMKVRRKWFWEDEQETLKTRVQEVIQEVREEVIKRPLEAGATVAAVLPAAPAPSDTQKKGLISSFRKKT